jgi:AraC-like DNA-binding protein
MAINVRRERHSRKLSQKELADRAGLSSRYLDRLSARGFEQASLCWGGSPEAFRINPCGVIRTTWRR